jgi:NAD(P)H-dependent FMN reductase
MTTVICGTNRENSNSSIISKIYEDLIQKEEEQVAVLYLKDLPKGFAYDEINGAKSDEFNFVIENYIKLANRFVFIIPEYNGGFPGVLKSFIDSIPPKYFNFKKAALVGVSSGHAGALRPLDQFTNVLHYLKVEVFSNKPKLSSIEALLDDDKINDADALKRLSEHVETFLKY